MDLKKKFGISELLTGYKYIDSLESEYNTAEDFYKALHYIQWLNETKLTSELVEKLFKRVEKQPRNTMTRYILGVDSFADGDGFILGFDGKKWFTNSCSHIETLADLARLTAAYPILLA